MTEIAGCCAVCGAGEPVGARMSRLVIEGRPLELCRAHASTVVTARPVTFEELRQLFRGRLAGDGGSGVERRSPIGRRAEDDRRAFPPRPEGRRMGDGRRANDRPE